MKKFFIFFTFCVFSLLSCKTTRASKADFSNKKEDDKLKCFFLDNDIPVYVKENYNNKLVTVAINVSGGAALLPSEYSGLELFLGKMLKSGSEKYSFEDIQNITYDKQANFWGSASLYGLSLGVSCLNYYLDDLLPIMFDGFFNPTYRDDVFNNSKEEFKQRLRSTLNDPMSFAVNTAITSIYKNHPYECQPMATEKSIDNITVENLKALHKKALNADRISVTVVGNVDSEKIVKKLNKALKNIPSLGSPIYPEIPKIVVGDENIVLPLHSASGSGFMVQCFEAPSIDDKDFTTACIVSSIYSDILFQVVREKYGACYSPSVSILRSNASIGSIILYRISDLENITRYVNEAQKVMQNGNVIVGRNSDNSFVFADLENELEGYKNSYINSGFASQRSNFGLASKLCESILSLGNPEQLDIIMKEAKNVTKEDVLRVFEKYFVNTKKQWFCVTGAEDVEKVRF